MIFNESKIIERVIILNVILLDGIFQCWMNIAR